MESQKILEKKAFRKIYLTFSDKEIETQFRLNYHNKSIAKARIALITTAILIAGFTIFDKVASPLYYRDFYLLRYLIVIPFLITLFFLSFVKNIIRVWELLMFMAMLVTGSSLIYLMRHDLNNSFYNAGLFLIITGGYFFINLRFFKAALGGWLLVLIYNLVCIYQFSNRPDEITALLIDNAFFVSFNIISMIGLYNNELLERLNFLRERALIQKQNEIERINADLENKVIKRTKDLTLAKEKAEESDQLKSAFLANMSHEIRTPMNGILGFTNLLKEPKLSAEEHSLFLEMIDKSGQRMLNTVNDIIEISQIEAKQVKLNFTEVDVVNEVEELISFFTSEANAKNVNLYSTNLLNAEEYRIKTDQTKLQSILTNLIKNAIKFTEQGHIELKFQFDDTCLLFSVSDTGIGIAPDRITAIFNRFEQADIRDKQAKQGSGLGLAISESYVEMLNGKIWVESKNQGPQTGSVFYFKLPLD